MIIFPFKLKELYKVRKLASVSHDYCSFMITRINHEPLSSNLWAPLQVEMGR